VRGPPRLAEPRVSRDAAPSPYPLPGGERDSWFLLAIKLPVFGLAALPGVSLAWRLLDGALAANPYAVVIRESGLWSLRLLVVGFAITPLVVIGGLAPLARLRRMLGLFAAFYAALHVAAWAKDHGFAWSFLWDEIVARRYLTIGAIAALALLVPALTSGRAAERRLGPARWRRLHRLVELAIVAALVHYVMAGRAGLIELIGFGAALALLFGWRLARRFA
jgi:methionine sulfoxide reductase heme-binding subunit